MKRNKKICPKCNLPISLSNYTKHLAVCEKNRAKSIQNQHLDHEILNCQYCNKPCKNRRSLIQHEIRCKNNEARCDVSKFVDKTRPAWNKGLKKEKYPQLCRSPETREKIRTKSKAYRHSVETIEKMKTNPKIGGLRKGSGRGKKGHYKGYYCDSTYELVWTIYCLDHNIWFKRCSKSYPYIYKGEQHRYYPDYVLEDNSLIEIKGYHNELVDIKIASVSDVPIKVLYKEDLKEMFDYVEKNYAYKCITDLYEQ